MQCNQVRTIGLVVRILWPHTGHHLMRHLSGSGPYLSSSMNGPRRLNFHFDFFLFYIPKPRSILPELLPDGGARIIPTPMTRFEPTSLDLQQTRTFWRLYRLSYSAVATSTLTWTYLRSGTRFNLTHPFILRREIHIFHFAIMS